MQAILMSIKPYWVAKILNGDKTVEIRKRFPVDYRGWIYIYETNDRKPLFAVNCDDKIFKKVSMSRGKVVARFYCDKIMANDRTNCCQGSCLSHDEILHYTRGHEFVGVHISQLGIFDKPKELSDFYRCRLGRNNCYMKRCDEKDCPCFKPVKKAPQSYMYIEVSE